MTYVGIRTAFAVRIPVFLLFSHPFKVKTQPENPEFLTTLINRKKEEKDVRL